VGSARSFVGNAMGGVRGWSNAASWAVAGSLAYYLWVRPARELKKEQEVSISIPPLLLIPVSSVVVFCWVEHSGRVAFSDHRIQVAVTHVCACLLLLLLVGTGELSTIFFCQISFH
jgi:hypothetical protein